MRQGDDTQRQNVTLLVFTVVTVVFVSFHFHFHPLECSSSDIVIDRSFQCPSYPVSLA